MEKETTGRVVSASKQWWMKVNTKPVHMGPLDGAAFPYIITVSYEAEGKEYRKKKWISAGAFVPAVGNPVKVVYDADRPAKAKIIC